VGPPFKALIAEWSEGAIDGAPTLGDAGHTAPEAEGAHARRPIADTTGVGALDPARMARARRLLRTWHQILVSRGGSG